MNTIEIYKGSVAVEYPVKSRENRKFSVKAESGENTLYNEVLGTLLEKICHSGTRFSGRALGYMAAGQWVNRMVTEMLSGTRRKEKSDFDYEERELFYELGLPMPFSICKIKTVDGLVYLPYRVNSADAAQRRLFYGLLGAFGRSAGVLKESELEHLNLDGLVGRLAAYFRQGVLDLLPLEWAILRKINFRINKVQVFIKQKAITVTRNYKQHVNSLVYNRLLDMVTDGLEKAQDELGAEEMDYITLPNGINRIAKKIQEDWSGEYVHFEGAERQLLSKIKINVLSEQRSLIGRDGVSYMLQYRRMHASEQTCLEELLRGMEQFPLRGQQMKYLLSMGVNRLARILNTDRNYQAVIRDHELRRIFTLMGIRLNSEQFVVKAQGQAVVTFTVPNNPDDVQRVFYTRLIKNGRQCSLEDLERLREFGLEKVFNPNEAMPQDVNVIFQKMRIERPVHIEKTAAV